jgi:hypothetical protein
MYMKTNDKDKMSWFPAAQVARETSGCDPEVRHSKQGRRTRVRITFLEKVEPKGGMR